jgi:hypothetical protein
MRRASSGCRGRVGGLTGGELDGGGVVQRCGDLVPVDLLPGIDLQHGPFLRVIFTVKSESGLPMPSLGIASGSVTLENGIGRGQHRARERSCTGLAECRKPEVHYRPDHRDCDRSSQSRPSAEPGHRWFVRCSCSSSRSGSASGVRCPGSATGDTHRPCPAGTRPWRPSLRRVVDGTSNERESPHVSPGSRTREPTPADSD